MFLHGLPVLLHPSKNLVQLPRLQLPLCSLERWQPQVLLLTFLGLLISVYDSFAPPGFAPRVAEVLPAVFLYLSIKIHFISMVDLLGSLLIRHY